MYLVVYPNKTVPTRNFDPDVINAVYEARSQVEQVVRGSSIELGTFLYDPENGWSFDNLTARELTSLRAAFKSSSKNLWLNAY